MTVVTDLIDQMEHHVPPTAPFGTRWQGQAQVCVGQVAHQVRVGARIDAKGCRREQYGVDGFRVERGILLRLTCPEAECPQARAVRRQWDSFHGRAGARACVAPMRAEPLMHEAPVVVGGHRCVARPQRFACFTPCPHQAHPPMTIDKTGYDLFEDGQYLGGGLTVDNGVTRPRLPTLQAAEAYVLARQLEALVALADARGADGGTG